MHDLSGPGERQRPSDPEPLGFDTAYYIPPDPDEPPPIDLASAVGDIVPWGTALLVLSWVAVFAALAFRREIGDSEVLFAWGANSTGLDARDTAWRLLSSTFLHAGIGHVFFNALSMAIFGPSVERIFTRWGFWTIYAAGGAIASLASLAWRGVRDTDGVSISVGASGAIFALGGALLVSAWRLRRRLAPSRSRAMAGALLFLIGQSLSAGFTRHATDNAAHVAGFAAGILLGALTPLSPLLGGRAPGVLMRGLGATAAAALAVSLVMAVRGGFAY